MATHYFDSTADAYNACQYGLVEDFDILVIESEKVIGIAHTWLLCKAVAWSLACGKLHMPYSFAEWADSVGVPEHVLEQAEAMCMHRGW